MKYPTLNEEKKLWKQGFEYVVGLDEAGRGPLAGPVTAAAVSLFKPINLKGINDSKKLSEKQREYFYEKLTNHKDIKWGIGIVPEKQIDEINILNATKLAMLTALEKLPYIIEGQCALLIDGNFRLTTPISQRSIIKGDSKVFSIAAAGILAKVTRDRLMKEFHAQYPEYGFDRHKGYGTKTHLSSLYTFGPCEIHRKSFFPVSVLSKPQLSDNIREI